MTEQEMVKEFLSGITVPCVGDVVDVDGEAAEVLSVDNVRVSYIDDDEENPLIELPILVAFEDGDELEVYIDCDGAINS